MSKIVIFGAGGKLGRLLVAEAVRRGHEVTAAVRDPSRNPDLAAEPFRGAAEAPAAAGSPAATAGSSAATAGSSAATAGSSAASAGAPAAAASAAANAARPSVRLVAADATSPGAVAAAAAGHDAAIATLYQRDLPHDVFCNRATHALLGGLARTGVPRLLFVGMAANLELPSGTRIMDAPDFPPEHLPFTLGHTVALHVLRAAETPVDWLMLTPPMTFAADGERTGAYRTGADAVIGDQLSYADSAVAALDEIDAPAHHRTRIAIAA